MPRNKKKSLRATKRVPGREAIIMEMARATMTRTECGADYKAKEKAYNRGMDADSWETGPMKHPKNPKKSGKEIRPIAIDINGQETKPEEPQKKKASKAQQKAVAKYEKANYDKTLIRMPKGEKAKINEAAKAIGMSTNAYIMGAIRQRIRTDKAQQKAVEKYEQANYDNTLTRMPKTERDCNDIDIDMIPQEETKTEYKAIIIGDEKTSKSEKSEDYWEKMARRAVEAEMPYLNTIDGYSGLDIDKDPNYNEIDATAKAIIAYAATKQDPKNIDNDILETKTTKEPESDTPTRSCPNCGIAVAQASKSKYCSTNCRKRFSEKKKKALKT